MKIQKTDTITSIIEKHPNAREAFFQFNLPCLGCFAAQYETLEEGAGAHGIDVDALLDALNKAAGLA
jgi:hybrid cluster-associated redox disulfide protein